MAFTIDVRFLGGLSGSQQAVFNSAAKRWTKIITGDVPTVRVLQLNEVIDGLLIFAWGARIDGLGDPATGRNVLGQASPIAFRPGSGIPAAGFMEFDSADLLNMQMNGSLENVIVHEMGHVLGIGTIWEDAGLLVGGGTRNPRFIGPRAMEEYAKLVESDTPVPVPVANVGGPGTADGHWRESVLDTELMTGTLDPGTNPLSRITVGSLEDLGYGVDFDAADAYTLPGARELAVLGVGADPIVCRRCCQACSSNRFPERYVLTEEALVDGK